MKLSFRIGLALIMALAPGQAARISIDDVPERLPRDTGLATYSPLLRFGYSDLSMGQRYLLKVWLLAPGPWFCASSQWCERLVPIDNTAGTNGSGTVEFVENMDVYGYGLFDWVLRLYDQDGAQVAFAERYVSATLNRAPTLSVSGGRSGIVGQPLALVVSAVNPEGGALTLGATNLPPGGTFDAASGMLRWVPTTTGTFGPVLIWAQDAEEGAMRDVERITLEAVSAPTIVNQPQSQAVGPGANVTFSVVATSESPIAYQWRLNGTNLVHATNAALVLPNVSLVNAGTYSVQLTDSSSSILSSDAVLTVFTNRTPGLSASFSVEHLRRVQDQFHTNYGVFEDISSGGNHFHARGKIPGESAPVTLDGGWTNRPYAGATCIRCALTNSPSSDFGGFYFMNGILVGSAPMPYFGTTNVPGTDVVLSKPSGIDLSGASALSFWARGENGGEKIEFFVGGVGRNATSGDPEAGTPFPDSMRRFPALGTVTTLTAEWKRYTISLAGRNLTNIMGAFAWVAQQALNPTGAVFYLDSIEFVLSPQRKATRLSEPRFLQSYVTRPVQPSLDDGNPDDDFDFVLRNTAFLYDNALALLAFLAEGSSDSVRRARLIGDAMVYAAEHDRTYSVGRLRSAYASGDIALPPGWEPNGMKRTVPVPGFYLDNPPRFFEVENRDVDVGNNAWAMIALTALYRETGETNYLHVTKRIADFVERFRDNEGRYQGYRGGIWFAESMTPSNRVYASTEHNLDLYAAFFQLYRTTGEARWLSDANHARGFVEAMWDAELGGYRTGTTEVDPEMRNESAGQLPLDTQSWSVAALSGSVSYADAVSCAERNHRNSADGFTGFDFNEDRDGVWFEGTAQMVVAYAITGASDQVDAGRLVLHAAQQMPPPHGDGLGLVAASHDGVSTGFGFKLYRRLHIGATAWNVFAQLRYNPYYQTEAICHLTPVNVGRPDLFVMRVNGEGNRRYAVERTSDLKAWQPFVTNSSASGIFSVTNTDTVGQPHRFYRARLLP